MLTVKQVAALATALGEDQAVFMWLGLEGLRWSEAAGMTADRVDLKHGSHHRRPPAGPSRQLRTTKVRTGEPFAINQALVDDLRALIRRHCDGLLFEDSIGGHLRYSNWRRRVWQPACIKVGLSNLTFHDLRALAGTTLIAAGAT